MLNKINHILCIIAIMFSCYILFNPKYNTDNTETPRYNVNNKCDLNPTTGERGLNDCIK